MINFDQFDQFDASTAAGRYRASVIRGRYQNVLWAANEIQRMVHLGKLAPRDLSCLLQSLLTFAHSTSSFIATTGCTTAHYVSIHMLVFEKLAAQLAAHLLI